MGTTLANLRATLNTDLGVTVDAETAPWTQAQRNTAISEGYKALSQERAWKPVIVTVATVQDQQIYASVSGITELAFAEIVDSQGHILDRLQAILEPDGAGGFELFCSPLSSGYSIKLHGWTPYVYTFAGESSQDDLDPIWQRIPLLKAREICYRQYLANFFRYAQRATTAPSLNVTADQLLGMITVCMREFATGVSEMRKRQQRYMQPARRRF